jgi:hypothetical protein
MTPTIAASILLAVSAVGNMVQAFRAKKEAKPTKSVVVPASVTPSAPAPPVTFAATTAAAHVECVTCHRTVARFTLTDKGPVCANCQP